MAANKESDDTKEVASAPPVQSAVLRQNKLQPLSSPRPVTSAKQPSEMSADSGKDLPVDITDNDETDRAVDAISGKEADEVLASEDVVREEAESGVPKHRIRAFFSAWLGTKRGWKWTFIVLFVVLVGLAATPKTRYWALNAAGVRCSLSLTTTDGNTQLALPGVTAGVGSEHGKTDHAGIVVLHNLKLGSQTLLISRPGFAQITEHLVLGWGSNPLGSISMKGVGQQYTILVHDYVSGAVVAGASVNDGGLQALGDKNGKITLTISNSSEQPVPIVVSAPGYAAKSVTLGGTGTKPVSVSLAPSEKEVYVESQGGLYNLYSSNADGTSKQRLLAGTATETSNIALAASPDGSQVALVSTRDTNTDGTGRLLQAITLVSMSDGTPLTLDHALQIQLIGWAGTTIIYEEQTADASYSVISYNYATNSRNQLATSSQFTGVSLAGGTLYYAIPAAASSATQGFYAIQPNGSGKQTILSQDSWAMLRTSYTDFSLQSANGWYDYSTGSSSASTLNSPPSNLTSTQFLDSADGKQSISELNGQLHVYTIASGRDRTIGAASGAAYPLRWLNNSDVVYRVTNGGGSADYVVNLNGGAPRQITTLTNTTSIAGS